MAALLFEPARTRPCRGAHDAGRRHHHQAARRHARRRGHAAGARTTSTSAYFRTEMDRLFAREWICAGRSEQVAAPGQYFVREVLGESIIITRAASGTVQAFYNVCRHRGTRLCRDRRDSSPAASSARITPGPTGSTAGWSARRTWTRCRTSARRTIRCTASHADDVGRAHLHLARRGPAAATRAARRSARQVRQLADAGPPPRPPHRLRRAGQLEADRPELQRVPALPEPAPGAQQAVALPERRERAAAPDLHGRPDGPAARRRRRCRWTGRVRARSCRGSRTTERRGDLLLRDLPQPAPQPAPGLHDGAHAVAAGAGPHDQHLRVALPSRGAGAPRLRCRRRDRVLGHDEPSGLARLRAVAGGDLVPRLRARARTRIARICSTPSIG